MLKRQTHSCNGNLQCPIKKFEYLIPLSISLKKLIQIKPCWQISQNQCDNHIEKKENSIEPCEDCGRNCRKTSVSWEFAQKTGQHKEDCWPGIYWSSVSCARGQASNTAHSTRTRTRIVHSFTFQPFSPHYRHKNITGFTKTFGCGREKSFFYDLYSM